MKDWWENYAFLVMNHPDYHARRIFCQVSPFGSQPRGERHLLALSICQSRLAYCSHELSADFLVHWGSRRNSIALTNTSIPINNQARKLLQRMILMYKGIVYSCRTIPCFKFFKRRILLSLQALWDPGGCTSGKERLSVLKKGILGPESTHRVTNTRTHDSLAQICPFHKICGFWQI